MNKHLLISLVLASLAVTGCQSSKPTVIQAPAQSLVKQWQATLDVGRDRINALHLRDNVLIAYSENNQGYWLSSTGGQILAINQIAPPRHRIYPPVAVKEFLAIPTTLSLKEYNARGEEVDTLKVPTAIQGPAAGVGNTLYLAVAAEGSGRLAKFTIGNLVTRGWEMYTSQGLIAAPATFNDAIFAAGVDGRVWAVNANRAPLWDLPSNSFKTDGQITADLSVDDFGVYVASQDQKLYCLDRTTGKIKWSFYTDMPLFEQPLPIGNTVYQFIPTQGLAAVNKTEGKFNRTAMWVQPKATQILSSDEKFLYVRMDDGRIAALDPATGKAQFYSRRHDLTIFATNLHSSMIYAATTRGQVFAIKPILTPGTVGELVLETQEIQMPIMAMAQ